MKITVDPRQTATANPPHRRVLVVIPLLAHVATVLCLGWQSILDTYSNVKPWLATNKAHIHSND